MAWPPASTGASEHRGHRRITVASLCCTIDGVQSALTEPTEVDRSPGPRTFSTSDASQTRAKCHQLGFLETSVSQPSLLPLHSENQSGPGLANHDSYINRPHSANNLHGAHHSISGDSSIISAAAGHPHMIHRGAVQQEDRSRGIAVLPSSTMRTIPARSEMLCTHHSTIPRVQSTTLLAPTEVPQRPPRLARPSYTEEQKFFIMYYRVVRKLPWPEIENKFASFYNMRTRDGLTAVYYRTRKEWGMEAVLKNKSRSSADGSKVEYRANHFSEDFLAELGYSQPD